MANQTLLQLVEVRIKAVTRNIGTRYIYPYWAIIAIKFHQIFIVGVNLSTKSQCYVGLVLVLDIRDYHSNEMSLHL